MLCSLGCYSLSTLLPQFPGCYSLGCTSAYWALELSGRRKCPFCQDATLPCTVLQRCPMPRILKEPEGWELSIFRYTLVPATLDRAMLSRSGVFTWRGSWAAMAGRQEGDTKDQDSCSPELYDPRLHTHDDKGRAQNKISAGTLLSPELEGHEFRNFLRLQGKGLA